MLQVVQATCPHCRQTLRIPAQWLQQTMRCKHCNKTFQGKARTAAQGQPAPAAPPAPAASPVTARPPAAAPGSGAKRRNGHAPVAAPAPEARPAPVAVPVASPAPVAVPAATAFTAAPAAPRGTGGAFEFDDYAPAEESAPRPKYRRRARWKAWLTTLAVLAAASVVLVYAGPVLIDLGATAWRKAEGRDGNPSRVPPGRSGGQDDDVETPGDGGGRTGGPLAQGNPGRKSDPRPSNGAFPRRALAISINDYLLANSLNYGESRSQGFAGSSSKAILNAFGNFYMKFPNTQLFELSDYSRTGEAPIKPVIEKTIADFLRQSRPQDRLVILFTGHAVALDGEAYLVPIEGDLEDKSTLVPLAWVYDKMAKSDAAQKVLILDLCRYDPARGRERPGGEPMTEDMEKALQSPPEGVQVWYSCVPGQQSYEFERGSVFMQAVCEAMWARLEGFQEPEDPLPLDQLYPRAEKFLKARLGPLKLEQTSKLVGTPPASPAPYDPSQPMPDELVIQPPPVKGGAAGRAVVAEIIDEINAAPPPRVNRPGAKDGLRLASLPPFSAKVLEDYATDGYADEMAFASDPELAKKFPLRAVIVRAKKVMQENAETFQIKEYLPGNTSSKEFKEAIAKEQEKPGKAIFFIEEAMGELMEAEDLLEKEPSKRWQAHYHYVLGRLKSRLIYLYEYSYLLGLIRRDALPALEGDQTGYRLGAVERPTTNEAEVRNWRRDLRKVWDGIVEDYPGTPWALLARREQLTALGMEWRPSRD